MWFWRGRKHASKLNVFINGRQERFSCRPVAELVCLLQNGVPCLQSRTMSCILRNMESVSKSWPESSASHWMFSHCLGRIWNSPLGSNSGILGHPEALFHQFNPAQSLSHIQLFATPWTCSTPGLPVHHHLPEFTQTHVHLVSDAIQPSHPLLSSSSPAFNLSQHQHLFQWVSPFA